MRAGLAVSLVLMLTSCVSSAAEREAQRNKAVVQGYMQEIINEGNWSAWNRYLAEGVIFNGSELTVEGIRDLQTEFEDFELRIAEQIAEGDTVVTFVLIRGTPAGAGREVELRGYALDRLHDGKVVEMWHETFPARSGPGD